MSRKNIGLTLIEVLVVITILSVLSLSVYIVFKSGMDAWSKSEAHLEIYQNARVVLDQMSRELPGAFVGGGATFVGVNSDPDLLLFITSHADSLYAILYLHDSVNNVLRRYYIEFPDYSDWDWVITDFGFMISDIQFLYWKTGTTTDWTDAEDSWLSGDTLPEAVKVVITLKESPTDPAAKDYTFETVVCLPGSE